MANRKLLFSVDLSHCEVSHMRAGGPGGQNQNKRDSATLIIHRPSGARGESRNSRSQFENTKHAFRRLTDHPLFRLWIHQEVRRLEGHETPEVIVDRMMNDPRQLKIEVRDENGRWVEVDYSDPLEPISHIRSNGIDIFAGGPA
tara:strand:- start:20198 stop:20629 length:432 start_codon:yes stop_codon:yes gene_type:complete